MKDPIFKTLKRLRQLTGKPSNESFQDPVKLFDEIEADIVNRLAPRLERKQAKEIAGLITYPIRQWIEGWLEKVFKAERQNLKNYIAGFAAGIDADPRWPWDSLAVRVQLSEDIHGQLDRQSNLAGSHRKRRSSGEDRKRLPVSCEDPKATPNDLEWEAESPA